MDAKKIGFVLALIMPLVLASLFAVPVMAPTSEEASATASVTVNKFVDITFTVNETIAGISFGSLDPATSNNPDLDQTSTTPAAAVTRQTTSNTDIAIRLNGTDFSGAGTIAVGNLKYNSTSSVAGATTMTNAYPGSAFATLTSGSPTLNLWFWLDIPSGQAQGVYTSTINVQGS